MPEHDHDRLEEFFRKASIRADVPFNEEDWKKLEVRLDAAEAAGVSPNRKTGSKITSAVVAGAILLLTGAWWANSRYEMIGFEQTKQIAETTDEKNEVALEESGHTRTYESPEEAHANTNGKESVPVQDAAAKVDPLLAGKEIGNQTFIQLPGVRNNTFTDNGLNKITDEGDPQIAGGEIQAPIHAAPTNEPVAELAVDSKKIFRELILISPANAEKIKQKADVDLPGAEEGDTGGADAIVTEEDASVKHVATPRLSLLLSFAPDFSSTSNQYAAPGKAFGAMIHYHVLPRWSVSAGVIKNNKKYTGDGEDYKPPAGYWKYYTNGIIPNSIDGSCSVLEFPFMVQYTIANHGKHRWLAAAGTSSYLMLNESYRYNFEEPNPGAKEGWDSKRSSRFYFNVVNITIGYERQVLPGLMIGIEPYVKIPMEEIGWSNVRLFSTGASFTMRYKILGRKDIDIPSRSRGPG